ncbi:MAG: serine hydrolase [Coriobacteriia bacterium]|nr:serine hydrolase [Coriobacteriia bacterium]
MMKTIKYILAITLAFAPGIAMAAANGNDLLYGESLTARNMTVADCPSITAKHAILMAKDGTIIYERDADTPAKIASMTKIMTAIIGMENAELTDQLEINDQAVKVGESSAGFWVGDKLDIKSALYALMVPSGNDAAEAICEYVGQKAVDNKDDKIRKKSPEDVKAEAKEKDIDEEDVPDVYITNKDEAFCELMNQKAAEIGCENTCFTNPHGLDDAEFQNDNQHSTAKDMAKITQYAMQNDLFRQIVSMGDTTIKVDRKGEQVELKLASTDALLGAYHGCIGVKTGVTDQAGACFSGAAVDDSGIEIYSIIMHSDNEAQRFIDTQGLWDWYFTNKVDYNLNNDDGVAAYVSHKDWADSCIPTTAEKTVPILTIAGNVYFHVEPNEVGGSYKAGDKVADMVCTQHNKEIARVPLLAIKDAPAPNIFEMIGVCFDRLGKILTGQPTCAQTTIMTKQEAFKKVGK